MYLDFGAKATVVGKSRGGCGRTVMVNTPEMEASWQTKARLNVHSGSHMITFGALV